MVRRAMLALVVALGAALGAVACRPEGESEVVIGETTYVCLVSSKGRFTAIQPPADRYSRLTVPKTYEANKDACEEELFHVESMGVSTSFRKRFCTSDQRFFPVLTAIIHVEMGKVASIAWDDGCYFTDDSVPLRVQRCESNAYELDSALPANGTELAPSLGSDTALTSSTCAEQSQSFCDLAVYVAWSGRDANGNYFGSSGRRFSIFRKYALQPQTDAMRIFLDEPQASA